MRVILSLARVPFAMARDGLLPARLGEVSRRSKAPVASVLVLTILACILALSGTFDQLTDLTIFGQWIFYGLTGVAVFVLRRKMPDAPRPYRVIFYPLTPIVFVACAAGLLVNSLANQPRRVRGRTTADRGRVAWIFLSPERNRMKMKDRVAIVTGGGTGIRACHLRTSCA